MNLKLLIITLGSLSVFFILQALFWWRRSRIRRREDLLSQRLGADDESEDDLMRTRYEGRFKSHLAELMRSAGEQQPDVNSFIQQASVYGAAGFLLAFIVLEQLFAGVCFSIVGAGFFYLRLLNKRDGRIALAEQQLPEALEMMIISLRAGQSLDQAIALNAQELPAPICEEFKQVSDETRFGLPLDEALKSMARRLDHAKTVRSFVISVLVLRQTGGNLVEVLETMIESMRQQAQYEHKLRSMTAEARSNARTLGALPPVFVLISYFINPDYPELVLGTRAGITMMLTSLFFYVLGFMWVRRLVKPRM